MCIFHMYVLQIFQNKLDVYKRVKKDVVGQWILNR